MLKKRSFYGVISALSTPFKLSGDLDLESFHHQIKLQKQAGINGIVVLGSTGEAATLSSEEAKELIYAALEHQNENFQIYVGSGTNSTKTTIEKSIEFSSIESHGKSIDGLLIVTPFYNKPQQEHLISHYHEVCSQISETPVCLYNVPGRTGVNMSANTLCAIASQNKNVVAIKEAAGQITAIADMRSLLNKQNLNEFLILSGDDATFAPALLSGANGIISVTSNLIPKAMCDILKYSEANEWNQVKDLHLKTYQLQNGISCVTNPVGIKYLLSQVSLCQNILRAPLYAANEHEGKELSSLLSDLRLKEIKLIGE